MKYLKSAKFAVGLAVIVSAAPVAGQTGSEVERAREIAHETIEVMGGEEAWAETRYLVWEWLGQTHYWDKWTGDFRWEEDSLASVININSKEGRYWIDGVEVTDPDSLKSRLDDVYWRWVNNSYWLVMPYKILDPGVHLRYMGERDTESGQPAYVLEMTFENVGLTPRNKYEILVDKDTGLVCEWAYYADRDDPEPRFTRPWSDWEEYHGIMLASGRGGGSFDMARIEAPEELPAGIFEGLSF